MEKKVRWTSEAEAVLTNIPDLVRENAATEIERVALAKGMAEVTVELMLEVREKMLGPERGRLPISGQDTSARRSFPWMMPRIMAKGAEVSSTWADVDMVMGKIHNREEWVKEWRAVAEKYDRLAQRAEEEKHYASACHWYTMAWQFYHWAEFIIYKNTEEKKYLIQKTSDCYARAGRYFQPPQEKVEIECDGYRFPAHFRLPTNYVRGSKVPVIILTGGFDSTKEEVYFMQKNFAFRGMASITWDGPGQAEARIHDIKYEANFFDKAFTKIIDYLQTRKDIDEHRIGAFGVCFGGFLTLRAGSKDKRIKGAIAVGTAYSYSATDGAKLPQTWVSMYAYAAGIEEDDKIRSLLDEFSLKAIIKEIHFPLCLVHATGDRFIPTSQIYRIGEEVNMPCKILIKEGGEHAAVSFAAELYPQAADWMHDQLINIPLKSEELPQETSEIVWTPEAKEFLSKIPDPMRQMASQGIPKKAKEKGVKEITVDFILEVRKEKFGG